MNTRGWVWTYTQTATTLPSAVTFDSSSSRPTTAHIVTAAASSQYKLFISCWNCATDSPLQGRVTSCRILKGATHPIFGWDSRHLLVCSLCVSVFVLSCTGACGHGACCKAWGVLSRRTTHDARTNLD